MFMLIGVRGTGLMTIITMPDVNNPVPLTKKTEKSLSALLFFSNYQLEFFFAAAASILLAVMVAAASVLPICSVLYCENAVSNNLKLQ